MHVPILVHGTYEMIKNVFLVNDHVIESSFLKTFMTSTYCFAFFLFLKIMKIIWMIFHILSSSLILQMAQIGQLFTPRDPKEYLIFGNLIFAAWIYTYTLVFH